MTMFSRCLAVSALVLPFIATPANADEPIDIEAVYTADVSATVAGGRDHRLRYLDNLDLAAEADFDALVGWHGARGFVYVLNNLGHRPNDGAGTAQGVDNIEVPRQGPHLFEAWLEQQFGPASLRVGLYDLNSEFYATDASSLLIAPPFGIGSELAATGVNGPSIFPSTGLAVRARVSFGEHCYAQAAVVNADARTWGDRGGIDTGFENGVLMITEAGGGDRLRLAAGAWSYSRKQDHVYLTDASGNPARRHGQGAYILSEWRAGEDMTLFARAGVSDGRTSAFRGGFQIGGLWEDVVPGRPDSAASLGLNHAWFSRGYRQGSRDSGVAPSLAETAVELTFTDRLLPHLSVQPDVQYILSPGGDANARNSLVTTLRVTVDF